LKTKAKNRITSSKQHLQNGVLLQFDKKIKLGTESQENETFLKDDDV
jgi:hypothetical protein